MARVHAGPPISAASTDLTSTACPSPPAPPRQSSQASTSLVTSRWSTGPSTQASPSNANSGTFPGPTIIRPRNEAADALAKAAYAQNAPFSTAVSRIDEVHNIIVDELRKLYPNARSLRAEHPPMYQHKGSAGKAAASLAGYALTAPSPVHGGTSTAKSRARLVRTVVYKNQPATALSAGLHTTVSVPDSAWRMDNLEFPASQRPKYFSAVVTAISSPKRTNISSHTSRRPAWPHACRAPPLPSPRQPLKAVCPPAVIPRSSANCPHSAGPKLGTLATSPAVHPPLPYHPWPQPPPATPSPNYMALSSRTHVAPLQPPTPLFELLPATLTESPATFVSHPSCYPPSSYLLPPRGPDKEGVDNTSAR
ncbi:hypothetical protein HPB48_001755 [Haemaphysalis longicornis]|uniref:Uncharacterized protein n=1 Tax=Haemaphysalis longicornis TaxID=44386 RepID=A0A9J6GP39_HAELO|nr:hypothetical protein HPB48_001755 [Haemaphysalis longicornis]